MIPAAVVGDLAASCPTLCRKEPPYSLAGQGGKVVSLATVPSAVGGGSCSLSEEPASRWPLNKLVPQVE